MHQPLDEFGLIGRHFTDVGRAPGVVLGIGDDAAVVDVPVGQQLVACTDTLVEGRHFSAGVSPGDLAWKALAVNVSDLFAMGAQPRWCTLALTLPAADDDWLTAFAAGLTQCAQRHGIALVGGDTTRGPLTITITALGLVAAGRAITRSGARPGDRLCLSAPVGAASAALAARGQGFAVPASWRAALDRPEPAAVANLADRATAAIDVSDGLLQDLGHILAASSVGALLDYAAIATLDALEPALAPDAAQHCRLSGGDDYALLYAVPPARLAPGDHVIGRCTSAARSIEWAKPPPVAVRPGYRHFAVS